MEDSEGYDMYFVNRSEIEQTVTHIDELITIAQETKSFASDIEKLGLERVVHVVIESILDVGNMMIDGFIMRDPGSYHDIIDILVDEKVIPAEEEVAYKAVIDLRQMLVQDYLAIDHTHVEKKSRCAQSYDERRPQRRRHRTGEDGVAESTQSHRARSGPGLGPMDGIKAAGQRNPDLTGATNDTGFSAADPCSATKTQELPQI